MFKKFKQHNFSEEDALHSYFGNNQGTDTAELTCCSLWKLLKINLKLSLTCLILLFISLESSLLSS